MAAGLCCFLTDVTIRFSTLFFSSQPDHAFWVNAKIVKDHIEEQIYLGGARSHLRLRFYGISAIGEQETEHVHLRQTTGVQFPSWISDELGKHI